MAASMDGASAVADPENRVTLRDPIRESEGLSHLLADANLHSIV